MKREEQAVMYNQGRNNCCQSVLLAYADRLKLSEEELRSLGAAFGAGMGGMEGNCGALCGAQMVLGMLKYHGKPIGADARAIHKEFVEKTGSAICKELKGIGTGKILCSCDDCVRYAVEVLEEKLEQES
ncbi:MAG: C-GCAxxG-C-C family protein [Eubacterium sp.]|nr:C-GCAxxG-C-C family protein [Eubacterium sp.]